MKQGLKLVADKRNHEAFWPITSNYYIINTKNYKTGYLTPASYYGWKLIKEIEIEKSTFF